MKVVFLDRDGVINEFPGNGKYVTKVKDFHFIPGSREAVRDLTAAGYVLFVVSNQAGVGKGLFTRDKLDRITQKMLSGIERAGGKIRKVYYSVAKSTDNCDMRKPRIGSILRGLKLIKHTINSVDESYFIGDTESDIQAGINAGCTTIFVLSGREDRRYMRKWSVKPDYIVKDLAAAARLIIEKNPAKSGHKRPSRNGKRRRLKTLF